MSTSGPAMPTSARFRFPKTVAGQHLCHCQGESWVSSTHLRSQMGPPQAIVSSFGASACCKSRSRGNRCPGIYTEQGSEADAPPSLRPHTMEFRVSRLRTEEEDVPAAKTRESIYPQSSPGLGVFQPGKYLRGIEQVGIGDQEPLGHGLGTGLQKGQAGDLK